MSIKDLCKTIIIKNVTTGEVAKTIDYVDFKFGNKVNDCSNFGFSIGELYFLQEILKILENGHEVYIFNGYKNQ